MILSKLSLSLSHPVKRKKILDYIHKQIAEIILLQETKLDEKLAETLKGNQYTEALCSGAKGKKNGIITVISKRSRINLTSHSTDKQGRWIISKLQKEYSEFFVTNIYAPTNDDSEFWEELEDNIKLIPDSATSVIAGDFNLTLDPIIDRNSSCKFKPKKSHTALKHLCNRFNMLDAWRLQNPTEREYTFYSFPHNSYSRIDYFLISGNAISRINQSTIEPRIGSDHSCVTLTLTD